MLSDKGAFTGRSCMARCIHNSETNTGLSTADHKQLHNKIEHLYIFLFTSSLNLPCMLWKYRPVFRQGDITSCPGSLPSNCFIFVLLFLHSKPQSIQSVFLIPLIVMSFNLLRTKPVGCIFHVRNHQVGMHLPWSLFATWNSITNTHFSVSMHLGTILKQSTF